MAAPVAVNPASLKRPVFASSTGLVSVSVIIVNWRSKDYVRECLRTIACDRKCCDYEVLVVDNASGDGCGAMLEEEFPEVQYIESRENLGFARANNAAFARSRGRQILFLNPDTEIVGDAIQTLSAALDAIPDAGMVGARLLNSDLSLQTTCITALPSIMNQTLNVEYLRRTFPSWSIWGMRPLFEDSRIPAPVEAISGACMLAHREVVEQVGGFSTEYFMYSEDMDLCMKVEKTGKKIYYVPEARIVHHAGGSSSKREESNFSSIAMRESLVHYLAQYRGRIYAKTYRCCMVLMCMVRLLLLAVATPMAMYPKGYRRLSRAAKKWVSILLWSLGMNHPVHKNRMEGERP